MTLPQPNKPVITDQVEDILGDILENCSYIDTAGKGMTVVSFTNSLPVFGAGTESVTGVGFEPSTVVLFSTIATINTMSIGFYAPSLGYSNNCIYRDYNGVWGLKPNACINHEYGYSNVGGITSTGSDGFTLTYLMVNAGTYTCKTVAFCIK